MVNNINRRNNTYGMSASEAIMRITKASRLTRYEKFKVIAIKVFLKGRMNRVCKRLYNFNYKSQTRMFKRVLRNTYAEGIVLNNLAEFHMMGITKCKIRNRDWTQFLTNDGKLKRG